MSGFRIAAQRTAFSLDLSDKKQKRIVDDAHLAFIRKLPSVISGREGCEACHIRYGDPVYRKKHTGMAQKPDDCWTLPMTPDEHRSQHGGNEQEWWVEHGIDPLHLSQAIYAVTGNRDAAIKIIRAGIERAKS